MATTTEFALYCHACGYQAAVPEPACLPRMMLAHLEQSRVEGKRCKGDDVEVRERQLELIPKPAA